MNIKPSDCHRANLLSIMKKLNLSKKIKIIFSICLAITSIISCQNKSISQDPISTPESVGNFPLKESWHKDFDNEIKAMALDSGVLVTGITDQNGAVIQAFDINSGVSLWKSNLQGNNNAGINIFIIDKLVYVTYSPSIFAIDLDTGKLVFENNFDAANIAEIKAFTDKYIFIVKISEGVFAFDRFTGLLSWQVLIGRGSIDVFTDTKHKLVYIVHGEYIKAVNETDGSLVWQKAIDSYSSVEFYDDFIYYSTEKTEDNSELHLKAIDLNVNDVIWDFKLTREIQCARATKDNIIAITEETIINLDRASGKKIWEYYTSPDIYCPIIIMNKVIYLKDGFSNQLIAISQENGSKLGSMDFEDSSWLGYATPEDNLLSSTYTFNTLALYLKNSIYVYK